MRKLQYPATLFALVVLTACVNLNEKKTRQSDAPQPVPAATPLLTAFNNYGYQGKADVTAFDVQQERHLEMRKAEQVSVVVIEDL